MPLPVIANVFRVTLNWTMSGQSAVNVLNIEAPGKTATDVWDDIEANIDGIIWGLQYDGAQVATVDILPLDGTSGSLTFVPTTASDWDGGQGTTGVPNAPAIVKFATGLRGPRHRGRIFLPFVAEGVMASGIITSGDLTAVRAGWVAFLNDMATAGSAIGVASYVHADWNQAINVTVEDKLATQRRRQDRLRV